VLDFWGGEGFGKDVGYHVFSRAVNEADFPFFDDPMDEMKTDVDMFRASVILVFFRKRDCRLIVREQRSGWQSFAESLEDKRAKPRASFAA